jgi:hypothetical protein
MMYSKGASAAPPDQYIIDPGRRNSGSTIKGPERKKSPPTCDELGK